MGDGGQPRPGYPRATVPGPATWPSPDGGGNTQAIPPALDPATAADSGASASVTSDRAPDAGLPDAPPTTGDLVIDGALAELAAVAADDLDALLRTGTAVEDVLRGRLRDLST